MKHSRSYFHFSSIFVTATAICMALMCFALGVCSQTQNALRTGAPDSIAYSQSLRPRNNNDDGDQFKVKSFKGHFERISTCIPESDSTFSKTGTTDDTFHHRSRIVTALDEDPDIGYSPTAGSTPRLEPLKVPEFRSFSEDRSFRHYLKRQNVIDKDELFNDRREWDSKHPDQTIFDGDSDDDPVVKERFHWKPAIEQSMILLGIQHGYALIAQEKTRRALKGPLFRDYWRSLKGLHGWDDGNRFFTNYVAHPMQGAMTGFIYVQNHDRVKKQTFAESPQYWRDRLKVFVWSAAWSTQWELGPISQSMIGNLGMHGGMAYVDLVITPTVGTTWMMSEEAIDRYVIRHIESKSFLVKILSRMFLNPMRTTSNLLRFKEPWYRDRPFGH